MARMKVVAAGATALGGAPTKRKRRAYTDAFKANAVGLVTGGKSVSAVARSLKIPESALRLWMAAGGTGKAIGGLGLKAFGFAGGGGQMSYFLQRVGAEDSWLDVGTFKNENDLLNAIKLAAQKDQQLNPLKDFRIYVGYVGTVDLGLATMPTTTTRGRTIYAAPHANGGSHRRKAKPEVHAHA